MWLRAFGKLKIRSRFRACFAQQARPQESLYPFPLRINRVSTEVTAAPMFVIRKYSHLNLMENVYHWVAVT